MPTRRLGGGAEAAPGGEQASHDRARHPERSDGLLRQGVVMRYDFVERHRGQWPPVRTICRVLRVPAASHACGRPGVGGPGATPRRASAASGSRPVGGPRMLEWWPAVPPSQGLGVAGGRGPVGARPAGDRRDEHRDRVVAQVGDEDAGAVGRDGDAGGSFPDREGCPTTARAWGLSTVTRPLTKRRLMTTKTKAPSGVTAMAEAPPPTGMGEPMTVGGSVVASSTVTVSAPVTKTRVPSGETAMAWGRFPTGMGRRRP